MQQIDDAVSITVVSETQMDSRISADLLIYISILYMCTVGMLTILESLESQSFFLIPVEEFRDFRESLTSDRLTVSLL